MLGERDGITSRPLRGCEGVPSAARGKGRGMRLTVVQVEAMMAESPPGTSLEAALSVFEVFASGTLTDEVYVLDDVAGKRIAIAPREIKTRFRPPA